ncbi:MAG: hypothetical protein IJA85_00685 [Clostridia bacterium]|nr:hypothetical protein [Clostridia bacterium]
MKFFKRIAASVLTLITLVSSVNAENIRLRGLDEYDKSSYSYYLDENLTCTEETLLTFDDADDFSRADAAEGIKDGAIGFTATKDRPQWQIISTDTDSFKLSVTDKLRQTVKLRVYVNDVDLIGCDHDAVYATPQTGSGTLYITLASKKGGLGHTWQHTFYGSGWHEMELSFDCHNVAYDSLDDIDYSNLTSLRVWCIAYEGLELRFDDMRLCTYDNPNYTEPEAPYGGRWLSTCDYDALDGVILTEWYGSCFDLENKTQGSSSVRITGHKENVDHRVCIAVDNVPINYDEDSICFDMYISDPALLGTDWQIRLEHNAQAAHYSMNYNIMTSNVVDEEMRYTYLKKGWNHFQIPFNEMNVNIGAAYKDVFTNDLELTQLMFFIAGTGADEEENYVINYDNFYVAKTADLKAAKAAMKAEREKAEETETTLSETQVSDIVGSSDGPTATLAAGGIGGVLPMIIVAAVIIVGAGAGIALVKRKK